MSALCDTEGVWGRFRQTSLRRFGEYGIYIGIMNGFPLSKAFIVWDGGQRGRFLEEYRCDRWRAAGETY